MEAMRIKDNADPFDWVCKLMNITGQTPLRGDFKVNNVVLTDVRTLNGKMIWIKFRDEDGCDYIFNELTDYEITKELSKPEYRERVKRKRQPKIDDLRFKLDKQYKALLFNGEFRLPKQDIEELKKIKKKRLSTMADDIELRTRAVYYKNHIVKEEKE